VCACFKHLKHITGLECLADPIHKSYGQSLTLPCASCTNSCKVNGNDVDGLVQDGNIIVPANKWSSYGTTCCNSDHQEICYLICPPLNGMYIIV